MFPNAVAEGHVVFMIYQFMQQVGAVIGYVLPLFFPLETNDTQMCVLLAQAFAIAPMLPQYSRSYHTTTMNQTTKFDRADTYMPAFLGWHG